MCIGASTGSGIGRRASRLGIWRRCGLVGRGRCCVGWRRRFCSGCWWGAWLRGRRWWCVVNGALRECGSGGRAGSRIATRSCGAACRSRRSRGRSWTWPRCSPSVLSLEPSTRPGFATARRRPQVEAVLLARRREQPRGGESARGHPWRRAGPAQLPRAAVPAAAYERRACRCRRPTARRAGGGSIAAGPSIGSPSSSTATAFTAHAMRGSATAVASVRRERAVTTSGASLSATWSSLAPCWPSSPRRCPDLAVVHRQLARTTEPAGVAWGVRVALAGDTMLGRLVAEEIERTGRAAVRRRRGGDRE